MADIPKMMVDQAKQVVGAVTVEPLKGLGKVATGVAEQTAETLVTGGQAPTAVKAGADSGGVSPQQVAQEDAAKLAKARQSLAAFQQKIQQTYQRTEAMEEQKKEAEEQQEKQEKAQEKSVAEQAREAALMQAKRGGGTEAMREAK